MSKPKNDEQAAKSLAQLPGEPTTLKTSNSGELNLIPPENCTCGTLFTVRGRHGKKDCPYLSSQVDSLDRIFSPIVIDDLEIPEWWVKQTKAAIEEYVRESNIKELEMLLKNYVPGTNQYYTDPVRQLKKRIAQLRSTTPGEGE